MTATTSSKVRSRSGEPGGEVAEREVWRKRRMRPVHVVAELDDEIAAGLAVAERVEQEPVPDHAPVARDDIPRCVLDHERLAGLDGDKLVDRALRLRRLDLVIQAAMHDEEVAAGRGIGDGLGDP